MSEQTTTDALATEAIRSVRSGMVIGVGAGKTASRGIAALGERVRAGKLDIRVVPASDSAEAACRENGLTLTDSSGIERLDLLIDGADEVDRGMNMIKGSRGAVARERILATAAEERIYLVPVSKVSERVGTNSTLAVAVMPFGLEITRAEIRHLGFNGIVRRQLDGSLFLTDNANLILDVSLNGAGDLDEVSAQLHQIPGVVEHGLFTREAQAILIEHEDGNVERLVRDS